MGEPLDEDRITLEHLPETGTEIFGRQDQLQLLDKAWEGETPNLLSFVAWGGVGKSALVNKWLDTMRADNFRGALRVFGWSFYSQGTEGHTASSETFINEALTWFGDKETADSNKSAWVKAKTLARLIREEKTLLILDGMEPLQWGTGVMEGEIQDAGLNVLLKELAKDNPGLCVITTRVKIKGLQRYDTTLDQKQLERITPQAGRALLRVRGVHGTDARLEQLTRDFGEHALAVNLLSSYVKAYGWDAIEEIPNA